MDFAAAGLLDGLQGSEREHRVKLLARLAGDGFSLEELSKAVRENRLALLGVDEVLGGASALARSSSAPACRPG